MDRCRCLCLLCQLQDQIGRLSSKGSGRPYHFCFPVPTSRVEWAKQMAPNWVPLIGAQLQQPAGKARSAVG